MSDGWSKLHDIDPWADARSRVDFAIPLKDFPRLVSQLADPAGDARGHVQFGRQDGIAVADVEVEAMAHLTCQRCLAPLEWPVESRGRVAMVEEDEDTAALPAEHETILAPQRRLSVRDLVEEELLLALPVVPLHDAPHCADVAAGSRAAPAAPEGRQKPFAQLGELFKR
jgi:uncharacterized protein